MSDPRRGSLTSNVAWLILAQVTAKAAGVVALVLLARYLGDESFGRFAIALAIPTALEAAADLGLSWALVREGAGGSPELVRRLAYAAAVPKLGLAVAMVAGSNLIARAAGLQDEVVEAATIFAIGKSLDSMTYLMRSVFQAFERMEFDAVAQLFDALVRLTLIAYALVSEFGVVGVAKAFVVASFIVFLASAAVAKRRFLGPAAWDWALLPPLVLAGFPLAVIWLFDVVSLRAGTIATGILLGDAAAGNVAAALRFVEPLLLIPNVMATAVLPLAARHIAERRDTVPSLLLASTKVALILAIAAAVVLVCAGPEVLVLLLGPEFISARDLIPLVGLAVVPLFLHFLFVGFLVALRRPTMLIFAHVVGAAVNLFIVGSGSPALGPTAAALGLVVGETAFVVTLLAAVPEMRVLLARPLVLTLIAGIAAMAPRLAVGQIGVVLATALGLAILALAIRVIRPLNDRELTYLATTVPFGSGLFRRSLAILR